MLCANGWVASVVQQVGRIHAAAFSDANLYAEVANKAFFWMQPSFYNIDITCLHKEAAAAYFTQVSPVAPPFPLAPVTTYLTCTVYILPLIPSVIALITCLFTLVFKPLNLVGGPLQTESC